jgi:hypothetical protein
MMSPIISDSSANSMTTDKPYPGPVPWFMRAAKNGGRFWEHERPKEEENEINDMSSATEILHELRSTRVKSGASVVEGHRME